MFTRLWKDTHGAVISAEIAVIGTILIIGVIVGLSALRTAMVTESQDMADVVVSIDFTPTILPVEPPATSATASSSASPTTMADLQEQ